MYGSVNTHKLSSYKLSSYKLRMTSNQKIQLTHVISIVQTCSYEL